MKWLAALLFGAVVVPIPGAADWVKISSANFDLLTSSTERDARKTLENFELARDFFLRVESSLAVTPPPVTIVGFNSLREYKPYSPRDSALAYFLSDDQNDYIVMSDLETKRMRVAIHEYVHLLVRHSELSIPLWLNEGMAEVYSTLETRDGKLLLGAIPDDRAYALGRYNWMRLPALLGAGTKSREYNDPALEQMFYAQSCLLAHMLMLGEGYADKFPRFVERISAIGSAQTAFAEVYGKTDAEIEREMNAYFRRSVMGGATYVVASAKVEMGPMRRASEAEVGVVLANLTAQLGRREEAKKRLGILAAAFPDDGEIGGSLAKIELQNGERDAALAHYRQAVTHQPQDWRIYWNYARLLDSMGGELGPRLEALENALKRKADLTEARVRLGQNLYAAGRFSDALAQLKQVTKVEPKHAVALYVQMAYAALAVKQVADARRYGEEARKAVRKPEESIAVDQLFSRLEMPAAVEPAVEGTSTSSASEGADSERPILRRKPRPKQH